MRRLCFAPLRLCVSLVLLLAALSAFGQPRTLYTTHFFDWYRVSAERPYSSWQREWTYRPEWQQYGIRPEEIGNTENYYAAQMKMIRQAGFDGIHYEWYGIQPSDAFIAAIKATRMPVAMFYDQEIRFSGHPSYIKPTDEFLRTLIGDIGSFYDRIPRDLWLREANYTLPIIFYAYQFDGSYNRVEKWDRFYRNLLAGLTKRLSAPVHIYWTGTGSMAQVYAYQHFPQISSYAFGWWGGQPQTAARSVTLVANYDDAGAAVQGRAARTVANDLLYIEEGLRLAEVAAPRLVFNYGWNEYFEGENIFPDSTWSDWRLRALSAMVKHLKAMPSLPGPLSLKSGRGGVEGLPSALILADDLFVESSRRADPRYESERGLLDAYRYLFPQADVVIGTEADLAQMQKYRLIIALDVNRTAAQERNLLSLARSGRRVAVFAPDSQIPGSLVSQFAAGKITPALGSVPLPPANQWNGVVHSVDVDPARYPRFHIRVRNSPNTFYHIRFIGVDADGKTWENHDNGSPLDWQTTGGQWVERAEDAKAILEKYAGRPIVRITGLVLLLNATGISGDYHADYADARFTDAAGNVGASVDFGAAGWEYRASFQNDPTGTLSVGKFQPVQVNGRTAMRVILRARLPGDIPLDNTSVTFPMRPDTRALGWTTWGKRRVPLVLQRGHLLWVNSLSPSPDVYRALMPALGMPPVRIVRFTTFAVVKGSVTVNHPATPTVLAPAELPLDWIRMIQRADLPVPVSYAYPVTSRPLAEVRTRGGAARPVPLKTNVSEDGTCALPGMVTLQPGDTVDFYRVPVQIMPLGVNPVKVETANYSAKGVDLRLDGRGQVEFKPLRPGLQVLQKGRTASTKLRLPCRVRLVGTLEWHSGR
jgi:hypothetical protein